MNKSRRLKVLIVNPELLIEIIRNPSKFRIAAGQLPSDATVVGIGTSQRSWYSPDHHGIALTIHSETFAEVHESCLLEILLPLLGEVMDTYRDEETVFMAYLKQSGLSCTHQSASIIAHGIVHQQEQFDRSVVEAAKRLIEKSA